MFNTQSPFEENNTYLIKKKKKKKIEGFKKLKNSQNALLIKA